MTPEFNLPLKNNKLQLLFNCTVLYPYKNFMTIAIEPFM
jgi:hypothetical protein